MATFTARRLMRRSPQVVVEKDGTVAPALGQYARLFRVKPLDVTYRRIVRALGNATRTRSQRKQ